MSRRVIHYNHLSTAERLLVVEASPVWDLSPSAREHLLRATRSELPAIHSVYRMAQAGVPNAGEPAQFLPPKPGSTSQPRLVVPRGLFISHPKLLPVTARMIRFRSTGVQCVVVHDSWLGHDDPIQYLFWSRRYECGHQTWHQMDHRSIASFLHSLEPALSLAELVKQ